MFYSPVLIPLACEDAFILKLPSTRKQALVRVQVLHKAIATFMNSKSTGLWNPCILCFVFFSPILNKLYVKIIKSTC